MSNPTQWAQRHNAQQPPMYNYRAPRKTIPTSQTFSPNAEAACIYQHPKRQLIHLTSGPPAPLGTIARGPKLPHTVNRLTYNSFSM